VIRFGPLFDCPEPSLFVVGNKPADNRIVSVGDKVEWKYMEWVDPSCTARIRSSSAPAGAPTFDSGIMSPGNRFRFVFELPGTWEYTDVLNGGTGRITVVGGQTQ
jgi:hypothetical protein